MGGSGNESVDKLLDHIQAGRMDKWLDLVGFTIIERKAVLDMDRQVIAEVRDTAAAHVGSADVHGGIVTTPYGRFDKTKSQGLAVVHKGKDWHIDGIGPKAVRLIRGAKVGAKQTPEEVSFVSIQGALNKGWIKPE